MEVEENKVSDSTRIHNELLLHADQPRKRGDRTAKLKTVLKTKGWNHLTHEQQTLFTTITIHDSIFILIKNEQGTIQAPPAKIDITNLCPLRRPTYRNPEKSKDIIVELLKDTEARDITEPPTAACLSPIVLAMKPDGSKHVCLDCCGVNQHSHRHLPPSPFGRGSRNSCWK